MTVIPILPVRYICRLDQGHTVLNPYTPVVFERI